MENPVTLETEANWVQFALLPGIMVWRRTRETRGASYKGKNTERNTSRDQLVLSGEKLHKSVTLSGIQYEGDEGWFGMWWSTSCDQRVTT